MTIVPAYMAKQIENGTFCPIKALYGENPNIEDVPKKYRYLYDANELPEQFRHLFVKREDK